MWYLEYTIRNELSPPAGSLKGTRIEHVSLGINDRGKFEEALTEARKKWVEIQTKVGSDNVWGKYITWRAAF